MSSPTNNFLTLIPTTHRVANIPLFTSPIDGAASDESLIPALQKKRRSSSTATTESNATEEGTSPTETVERIVESPTEDVNVSANVAQPQPSTVHRFLKLGN